MKDDNFKEEDSVYFFLVDYDLMLFNSKLYKCLLFGKKFMFMAC